MNNFELIDDYLTNRLPEQDKVAFEKQVASDPSLKADLAMQKGILESVKKARAAELKAMLQKVPVGGGGSASISLPIMKMAAGVAGAALLIAALSYYFKDGHKGSPSMPSSLEDSIRKVDPSEFEPLEEPTAPVEVTEKKEEKKVEAVEKETSKKSLKKTPAQANQPKIDVVDPTKDMMMEETESTRVKNESGKTGVTSSRIAVDVLNNNKKFSFHYQFAKGKLVLYGSFDKSLYEILEINGDNHAVFLFYKDQYFLLDEKEMKVTPLEPIKDAALVDKLKEYRGR